MRAGRSWRRKWLPKGGLLLALFAGGVAASSPSQQREEWSADPDDQFLLDVTIRQLQLGDGVRAYKTPEGTCVVLGDLLNSLDVPVKIDFSAKKASGWAFTEKNRISIDYAGMTTSYGGKSERIAPGTIRETPEGWCVQTNALTRWFGIGIKPVTSGSVLLLESKTKLPVELAIERERRAAQLKPAKFDLKTLPQVRLPYRLWRAPSLDFMVSAGVTYRASDGVRVDRSTSLYAAGEIARLSYDARLSTDPKGVPTALGLKVYRSDQQAGLLGPLKATHFAFGDVAGLQSRVGGSAATGRGVVVTNRPLFNPTDFDKTRFEGDLPVGWEAELYRNGELLAFARPSTGNRYVFEDVQLLYGENRINIILYGPQGQVRSRDELINVGQENVPPGKTWYWAGVNQPGREVVALRGSLDSLDQPKVHGALSVEHGIDERTSVGALARMMLLEDERVTFVEGSVRRSIGSALVEVAGAKDSSGGSAARAQLSARLGAVNVRGEALVASDFYVDGLRQRTVKDVRLAVDAPLRFGRTLLPAHADVRLMRNEGGASQLEAAARLSANIRRFNLSTEVRYRQQYLAHGPAPPAELELGLIGTGRIGQVRMRAQALTEVAPGARFRSAELSAYWSASDDFDWEGALAYDADAQRARARVSHIRRFNTVAVAVTGEAATDGSVAAGVNLTFSLDPRHGLNFSRQPLAAAGAVRARVYRDSNDNGARDPQEPLEKGAFVTTGTRVSEVPTDASGSVLIGGLAPFVPLTVGLDESSLSDPALVPKKALQVVVPRPGVPAEVEIGLVGGGSIEGAIVKSGGLGFEGLMLELVDQSGKVTATAQTDYDGFFLFERVPYGRYLLRVAAVSAAAAKIMPDLNVAAEVSEDRSIARLGSTEVVPLLQVASSK